MATTIDLKKLRGELKGSDEPNSDSSAPEGEQQNRQELYAGRDYLGHVLFSWEEWEHDVDLAKSVNIALVGLLLIAAGIVVAFFGNFLFALFLAIAGGLTLHRAFRQPRLLSCAVTSRGVRAGNRIYEFESLKSFWIEYDPYHVRELRLESKHHLMPHLHIPLGDADPLRLREILLGFIREEENHSTLADVIARRLGF